MTTALNSFDRSAAGAYVRSTLGARNASSPPTVVGKWFVASHALFCEENRPTVWTDVDVSSNNPGLDTRVCGVAGTRILYGSRYAPKNYSTFTMYTGVTAVTSGPPKVQSSGRIIVPFALNGTTPYTSDDGAKTWVARTLSGRPAGASSQMARSLVLMSLSGRMHMMGTSVFNSDGKQHYYTFISDDGGTTWNYKTSVYNHADLQTPANRLFWMSGGILYLRIYFGTTISKLFRSSTDGNSWEEVGTPTNIGAQATEFNIVTTLPTGRQLQTFNQESWSLFENESLIRAKYSDNNFLTETLLPLGYERVIILPNGLAYALVSGMYSPSGATEVMESADLVTWTTYSFPNFSLVRAGNQVAYDFMHESMLVQ